MDISYINLILVEITAAGKLHALATTVLYVLLITFIYHSLILYYF